MAISTAPPRPGVHPWPMDTIPDPEVSERPTRRRFGAAYKVAILDELDRARRDQALDRLVFETTNLAAQDVLPIDFQRWPREGQGDGRLKRIASDRISI